MVRKEFNPIPVSRLPRDHWLVVVYEKAVARLAEPRPKSYWEQEAHKAVVFGSELKGMFPDHQPHPACIVAATVEWKRLVEQDLTDQASSDYLFHVACENFNRNMPWITFLETLAHWMYSHGHSRALCLSRFLHMVELKAEDAAGDA